MEINAKYAVARPTINNGDIILIRGNSFIAKSIQWADKAYWNHALLVFKVGDRLMAIQAVSQGVSPAFLSEVISQNTDFCILRLKFPQEIIDANVSIAMNKAENGIPYNTMQILQILFQRKLGIDIKKFGDSKSKNICSVYTGITYGSLFPINCWCESPEYLKDNFVTPQDLFRFKTEDQITTLANDFLG